MPIKLPADSKLQDQVNGKIHWGSTRDEVVQWLGEKHRIFGDDADAIVDIAERERRKAIRKNAILWIIFSSIGVVMAVGLLIAQVTGDFIVWGYPVYACYFLGVAGAIIMVRSIGRLLTGKTSGNVD